MPRNGISAHSQCWSCSPGAPELLESAPCHLLPHDSQPQTRAFGAFPPTARPTSPQGALLAPQPETQSGVRPGQALPSPFLASRERRRGPPLKRMRLSARLSGSGISLGFQPPKKAAGRRGPPAAGLEELQKLLCSHDLPRPEGLSTAAGPSPLASPSRGHNTCPLPTKVGRALALLPILRLRNLRPSGEWRG